MNKLRNNEEIVEFNSGDTITFVVTDGKLLLPKAFYNLFPLFKNYDNYGKNKNNGRQVGEYLDTRTTYFEYIEHVITGALSVYDYFEESLLHEAMHICGSEGGSPLEEGINELKTRELAQKYNIKIAAYGYSKEVEVAKRLQKILGNKIMDELTFIPLNERFEFLSARVGLKLAQLYQFLTREMLKISYESGYYQKNSHFNDPFEKAKLYETIDYSALYDVMNIYDKEEYIGDENDNKSKR